MTIFGKILLGLILVTAAVLIVRGAGKGDPVSIENKEATPEQTATTDNGVFDGSVKDLIARGGNYKCTFSQVVENSTSTGTIYISDKKMRGDFNSAVSAGGTNMNIESHMISDGDFFYSWSSAMPAGFKMKIDTTADTSTATQQTFDANQKLAYSCSPWSRDESQFALPAGVTFTEVNK